MGRKARLCWESQARLELFPGNYPQGIEFLQKYVDLLNGFKDQYGEQFTPAQILVDYAKAGKKFHK